MMQQFKNRSRFGLLLAVLTLVSAAPVLGQVEFTFEGYAKMDPGIDQVGAVMTVYGIASPPASAPTPLPMDFDNYQYTIAVTGMLVDSYVFDPVNAIKDFAFSGGAIQLFEDPIVGGTAADYQVPTTFTDGDAFLVAAVDIPWEMLLDDPMGFGYTGAGIGTCTLTGGSQLPNMMLVGYTPNGWTFAGTGIAEPSFFVSVEPGYDYVFGTKIIYPLDPTPNETQSFGQVKNLFR